MRRPRPGRLLSRLGRSLRGQTGRQVLKLVVYAAVCLAVLAGLVARIGGIDLFADRSGYDAALPDVTGLVPSDEVKVAGVAVGRVTGIHLDHGVAQVSFSLDRSVHLTSDAKVGIRWRNVLGQKYLYLYPATTGRALRPGAHLPVSQAVDSADVGAFLDAVGPILRAIDPAKANAFIEAFNTALDGNEGRIQQLLGDSAQIASSLGGHDAQVSGLITNLDTVVGGLAQRQDDLQAVIERFRGLSSGLAQNDDSLQLLVERFSAVQAKLDDLVTQGRGNIDATIANLVTIARVLAQHRDDLAESLATLPAGLGFYQRISSYGQWFNIRSQVTCLAAQTSCTNEALTSSALAGAPSSDAGSVVRYALTGGGP